MGLGIPSVFIHDALLSVWLSPHMLKVNTLDCESAAVRHRDEALLKGGQLIGATGDS